MIKIIGNYIDNTYVLHLKNLGIRIMNVIKMYLLILLAIPTFVLLMPILTLVAFLAGLYEVMAGKHSKEEMAF